MDLLQLEHFLAVCEERTFTRAAERVFRTQSAVSQSIKKLEDEVGAPLLARGVHDFALTESGRVVLEYARRMLRLRDEATREVQALKHLTAGRLLIGANELAAVYLLPGPVRSYLQKFPEIKVSIYNRHMGEVARQVLDREVDIGFVKEEPVFHELRCLEIATDDMVLIAPAQHRLASQRSVHISQLGNELFIMRHQCNVTEQTILRLFEQYDTPCRVVAELWSFENIKSFVRDGAGLAIVPRCTVEREIREKVLAVIPVAELSMPRKTLMVYHDQLSEPARQFLKIMQEFRISNTRLRTEEQEAKR